MTDRKSAAAAMLTPYGRSAADEQEFHAAALERAHTAIERLKESYATEWAPAALAEMYEALAAAQRDRMSRRDGFDRIYRIAHDMKGQGGTFGFPILTEIGESLCRLTAARDDASDGEFTVIKAHADTARRVILERVEGDGGEVGRRLMAELQAIIRNHLH